MTHFCVSRSNDVIDEGVKNILENHFADNEDSEEEDNLSFDSNITDATWKVDLSDFEDDMENEDFESLDTTPTNNNDISEIVPIVNNISGVSFDEVRSLFFFLVKSQSAVLHLKTLYDLWM